MLQAGTVSLPGRPVTPLTAVTRRMLLAVLLLAASTVMLYLGRGGYRDATHPGQPLPALACLYHATVTLSTAGFGDIVPVTDTARVVSIALITPIRVIFLILLVGYHPGGAGRTDSGELADQPVEVAGGGSHGHRRLRNQGPERDRTLGECGVPDASIVVVDASAEAVAEANSSGLVGISGDATRRACSTGRKLAARPRSSWR